MVVFTCQNCNESLKRTAVEKHYSTKCRKAPFLTCIDCLQDFRYDYNEHTSCVTEEERYGGKGVQVKPAGVKQNSWLEVVHHVARKNKNNQYKHFFAKLLLYQNVPRIEKKFVNFAKASLGCYDAKEASHIFLMIQTEFKNNSVDSTQKNNQTTNNNCNGNSCVEKQSGEEEFDNQSGNDSISENKKSDKKRNLNSECSEVSVNGEEHLTEDLGRETSPNLNNSKNKKPKKKKMKNAERTDEVRTEEKKGEENGQEEDTESRNKKKNKKKNRKSSEGDSNLLEDNNGEITDEVNGKSNKKKKNSKKSSEEIEAENEEVQNGNDEVKNSEDVPAKGDTEVEKFSKKELKKLRKKEKYEAECKLIEEAAVAAQNNEEDIVEDVEEDGEKNSKEGEGKGKNKKNKGVITAEEAAQLKGIVKKFKKRKAAASESEEADIEKRQKIQDEEVETSNTAEDISATVDPQETTVKKSEKFDWEIVVKELLRKSSDQELAIKRLSKKVLSEYQALKGDRESYEELMSKFNKKIKKIAGVRVLKDKVKLVG